MACRWFSPACICLDVPARSDLKRKKQEVWYGTPCRVRDAVPVRPWGHCCANEREHRWGYYFDSATLQFRYFVNDELPRTNDEGSPTNQCRMLSHRPTCQGSRRTRFLGFGFRHFLVIGCFVIRHYTASVEQLSDAVQLSRDAFMGTQLDERTTLFLQRFFQRHEPVADLLTRIDGPDAKTEWSFVEVVAGRLATDKLDSVLRVGD